jgi:CheY-like chemotaxis protein
MPEAPRRVLVIDDEPDIREVVQVALELTEGWEVRTAGSGGEGLALAAADPPDAILLDVMMPDLDGPATVQALRAEPATQTVPVVLLTAMLQGDDRRAFATLPVAGVVDKPFDPMGLGSQVAGLLGWRR